MATLEDMQLRKGRLEDLVQRIRETSARFQQSNRADQSILEKVNDLETKIGQAQNRIDDAEGKASSSDRVFIEEKEKLGPVFQKDRLYTNQDFTFFLFVIAYSVFTIAIVMSVEKKIKVFIGMAFVGFIVYLILRRYA
jgi:chromosome segregation ATPase